MWIKIEFTKTLSSAGSDSCFHKNENTFFFLERKIKSASPVVTIYEFGNFHNTILTAKSSNYQSESISQPGSIHLNIPVL